MVEGFFISYFFFASCLTAIEIVTIKPPHKVIAPNRKNTIEVGVIYFTSLFLSVPIVRLPSLQGLLLNIIESIIPIIITPQPKRIRAMVE